MLKLQHEADMAELRAATDLRREQAAQQERRALQEAEARLASAEANRGPSTYRVNVFSRRISDRELSTMIYNVLLPHE